MQMTLADRDLYLMQIEAQIAAKRKLLLEKQKVLKKESKQNEFLDIVRTDYKKYYQHIIKEKQDQTRAMNILKQYIDDIIVSGKLTDEDILNAKKEQRGILTEITEIRRNLDELIKDTGIQENKV